jgi:hypothetical protein
MAPKKKTAKEILEDILTEDAMRETLAKIDDFDEEVKTLEAADKGDFVDVLKDKFRRGEVQVQVMQIGPDGRLIDVSDKVNPRDLRPEHIEGIMTEDGRKVSIGRNPQSREAAFQLLKDLAALPRKTVDSTAESIRRMEEVLEESDKILEHWKR